MTRLSVNLNKVALLRNTRTIGIPSVIHAARLCIEAGARGITVHPRPDERHIRKSDVYELADFLSGFPEVEFNIEGNPFPEFLKIIKDVQPAQCTLVPDEPGALTSDHGWNLPADAERLRPILKEIRQLGSRISLFMDADSSQWEVVREIGADRVELYTEPYAASFGKPEFDSVFKKFASAASAAQRAGLGVNAGHDLNLKNLGRFCTIPGVLEVSIGHALISEALEMGLPTIVRAYLRILETAGSS